MNLPRRLSGRLLNFVRGHSALWWLRVILIAITLGLGVFLLLAISPWDPEIARYQQGNGTRSDYRYFMWIGLWWAAIANIGLAIFLFVLSPVLGRFWGGNGSAEPVGKLTRRQRSVLAAAVFGGAVIFSLHAIPRMGLSLWVDEETTARIETIGYPIRANEKLRADPFGDRFVIKPVRWSETIWNYHTANNHPLFSILSRTSSEIWNALDRPSPLHFHEQALRLPSYLATLGALLVLPMFLVRIGLFRAAVAVPLLMALHPWIIRFGSDARGYALTFLFAPLAAYALWRALHDFRWRWWVAFGLAEFLLMWSHLSGMYLLVVLNLWAFAAPWLMRLPADEAFGRNTRLFLANALSGMAFLQVFLPDFLEFRHTYVGTDASVAAMGWRQVREMVSWLFGGLSWSGLPDGHPFSFGLSERFGGQSWMLWGILAVLALLFVLGLAAFWRLGGARRWLALLLIVPMPMMYLLSYAQRMFLFDHYVVFATPWIVAGLAAGVGHLGGLLGRGKESLPALLGPAVLCAALFFWVAGPQRRAFCEHSLEPFRETVLMTRGTIDPDAPGYDDVLTAGFLRYTRMYDKHIYHIKKARDLHRLLKMSDASGKPLLIHYGQQALARNIAPEVTTVFDDPEIFKPMTKLYGLDGMSEIWIIRHDPVAAKGGAVP